MPVSFDEASAMIQAVNAHARGVGISVSAAVVDEGGLLQALGRMDEASPVTVEVAIAKAANSAFARRDGDSFVTMQRDRPAILEAFGQFLPRPVIPGLGGVVSRKQGRVVGAVGVSGGTAEQDLACAEAALKVLG